MRFKMLWVIGLSLLVSVVAWAEPAKQPYDVQREIHYVPEGDASQTLDVYLPKEIGDKPLPVVIWIHGGGWHAGNKSGCGSAFLVGQGYAAASVEYRFSQKALFPAQIQDCQAAIRFLRANAAKYHLDPDHFGVAGDSAGGHLVALVGTSGGKHAFAPIGGNEDQSDRVQAVCDFYGPADFNAVMKQADADKNVRNIFKFNTPADPYSSLIGVALNSDQAKGDAVSPVHYVSKDAPPFLILHGTHDALVPFAQSEELLAALKGAGVDALLQPFPNAGHGGAVFHKPEVHKLIKAFFDKNLRQMDVKVELLPEAEVTVAPAKEK
jgi:acetyl esterase/lipase